MKEIKIHNLSKYQVSLLDQMWAIDGDDEFQEWYQEQDEETQKDIDALVRLVILECIEEEEVLGDYKEAQEVLKRFRLQ
jgi:hypothetical protein